MDRVIEWTSFAQAVDPFGWTGPEARAKFRKLGLVDATGQPHAELLRHAIACRKNDRWAWDKDLLVALLESVGAQRLSPVDHQAWRAVEEFRRNMAASRRHEKAGRDQEARLMIVAASSALLQGVPPKNSKTRMEKLHALSRQMFLAGYPESFQEHLWVALNEDPGQAMAGAREALLDTSTPDTQRAAVRARL